MSLAPAGLPLPAQVIGESWLAPRRRATPGCFDWRQLLSVADRSKRVADRVEVFDHDAVLDDGVRLADFIDLARGLQVHRTGVDTVVDAQERHPDAIVIAIHQRPE